MSRIKSITKEQEASIPSYVDKWVSYSSTPVDFIKAKSAIERVYGLMGKDKPTVLIANGPIDAFWSAVAVQLVCGDKKAISTLYSTLDSTLRSTLYSTLDSTLGSMLRSTLYSTLDSTLDSTLRSTLYSTLDSTLDSTLRSTLYSTLDSTLGSTLRSTLYSTLDSTLRSTLGNQTNGRVKDAMKKAYDALYVTQYWGFWAGYYDFSDSIGVKLDEEKNSLFLEFCREIPLIYTFDGLAIICQKPEISWRVLPHEVGKPANRILHNESGPAIVYGDGFMVYALNNVRVPDWLVTTDAGKIDPRKALEEKNVDIQREIIRKVGAERMLKAAKAKTLDVFVDRHTKGGNKYKLMEMTVGENIRRKYLYFEHASFPGVFYAHPVEPNLKRALHARAWMLSVGDVSELERASDEEIKSCLPLEVA